jgi:hypothetical protein
MVREVKHDFFPVASLRGRGARDSAFIANSGEQRGEKTDARMFSTGPSAWRSDPYFLMASPSPDTYGDRIAFHRSHAARRLGVAFTPSHFALDSTRNCRARSTIDHIVR